MKEIIEASREQFSKPRAEVEEMIVQFHNPVVAAKPIPAPPKAPSAPVVAVAPRPTSVTPIQAKAVKTVPVPVAKKIVAIQPKPAETNVPVVPKATPAPLAPTKIEPKIEQPPRPVSLSALSPKPPSQRIDPKVQSPKNVSDLKNALAAALGKKNTSIPAPSVSSSHMPPPAESAKEVPEDILSKVLKVD
jgi:hypothetical protein